MFPMHASIQKIPANPWSFLKDQFDSDMFKATINKDKIHVVASAIVNAEQVNG